MNGSLTCYCFCFIYIFINNINSIKELKGKTVAVDAIGSSQHVFLSSMLANVGIETLEAFRDLTYPLGVGSYDAYAIPRRGFITKAAWSGELLTISGDIEVTEKFQRSYRLVRMPLQSVSEPVLKRAAPECRYVVTGANGRVALVGVARLGTDTSFQIDLAGRLPPGRYIVSALIAVNGNVMNAEMLRIPFVAFPQR